MASKRALSVLARSGNSVASSSRAGMATAAVPRPSRSSTPAPPALPKLEFPPLKKIEPSHGVHVATLHLRAYHPYALDLYTRFALHAASSLQIPTSGAAYLPTTKDLNTVIKSPFVHKKSQENFERKTHRRAIKVFDADRDVVDLLLRYLRRNSIGGVGIKAYVHEYVDYGFASGEMADLEGKLAGNEIEAAAAEIVRSFSGMEFEEPKEKSQVVEAEADAVAADAVDSAAEAEASAGETKAEVKAAGKDEAKPSATAGKATAKPAPSPKA